MAQHSPKWPACPECRHSGSADSPTGPCYICLDADRFEGSAPGEAGEVVDYTACTDGIPKPVVIRLPVPAWPPAKIRQEG